jgi:hypothetical protein
MKMDKRSLGELSEYQRLALQMFAERMGVGESHMVNWLNRLDDRPGAKPWTDLDRIAKRFEDCGCAEG